MLSLQGILVHVPAWLLPFQAPCMALQRSWVLEVCFSFLDAALDLGRGVEPTFQEELGDLNALLHEAAAVVPEVQYQLCRALSFEILHGRCDVCQGAGVEGRQVHMPDLQSRASRIKPTR